jgi:uncharacterized membrane protein
LVLSFATWWISGRAIWLVGGIAIGVVIPFTLHSMLPTNRPLEDTSLDTASEAAALLQRWGRLHEVRTLCGAAAFTILLISLA